MTREEAIEYNKNLREYMRIIDKESEYKFLKENYEALDLAIKALEQFEQEPVIELKVGDEVTVEGINGVVVREPYPIGSDNELFVLVWYGQSMSSNSIKNVVPTGRHFPQITDVLDLLTVKTAFDTLLSWQTSIEADREG